MTKAPPGRAGPSEFKPCRWRVRSPLRGQGSGGERRQLADDGEEIRVRSGGGDPWRSGLNGHVCRVVSGGPSDKWNLFTPDPLVMWWRLASAAYGHRPPGARAAAQIGRASCRGRAEIS